MLRVNFPLPDYPALTLVAYDDFFVHLNTIRQCPAAGFDQNRAFLGINYTLSPNFNIDAGYQLQLINTVLSGLANQANNIILVQLLINL
jgi:long-subunit fatty acid transport protein